MLKSSMDFFTKQLIPFLTEKKIDTIFFLGDLFDNRSYMKNEIHDEVYDLFDNKLKGFKIHILIGNHDCIFENTTSAHLLKFLKKFDNVNVVDSRSKIVTIDNKDILLVPWMHNMNETLDVFQDNEADIVMGHFDITGFNFNKWVLSKSGMSPDYFAGRYDLVFSGHFHTRTTKKISGTEFVYVGSPYQMTRADINEERGFVLLNVEKMKYGYFSNEVSTKFVEINYPEKLSESKIKNNKVDVFINYDKETYTPDEYDKYIQQVESFNPASMETFYTDKSNISTDFDIDDSSFANTRELIKVYMEQSELSNKEKVKDKMLSLHDEVKGDD